MAFISAAEVLWKAIDVESISAPKEKLVGMEERHAALAEKVCSPLANRKRC